MKRTLIMLAAGLVFATGHAHADGFNKTLFESWLAMRTGGGETDVYWYSEGLVKTFPGGETTAKMVGFDTSQLLRDPDNPNKAIQLSRKIFYFFDPETGERMDRPPIAYPHQVKTYELVEDDMIYTVESNNGSSVYTLGPMRNYSARDIAGVHYFNYAVFIERGTGKFENSDFYVQPDESLSEQQRYQHVWTSYGVGPIMSTAVAWRYSSFEALPEQIREIVRAEAPLWMKPPASLEEINELRNAVRTASTN